VIGFSFASLDELSDVYVNLDEGQGFVTVECLAFVGDQVAYKILLQGESSEEGDIVPWRVTVPGPITSSNADQVDGSTATWFLGGNLGQIALDLNVGDSGRCPTEGFELRLLANADGTGSAVLRAPKLTTGEADTAVFVSDLVARGWAVEPLAPGSGTFDATQAWNDASGLGTLVGSLPPLEGSTIDLVRDEASGETGFDALVDLSFYETYWRNINPTQANPAFLLAYVPADGVLLTAGDWTDESALTFDWTVDDDRRIFNLFATTGPGGIAAENPEQADDNDQPPDTNTRATDAENPDGDPTGDGADGEGQANEGGESGETAQPATPPPDLTEQEATQALLDLLDSQEVSENEALATAIAGLAAAAAAGMLTLAEAPKSWPMPQPAIARMPAAVQGKPTRHRRRQPLPLRRLSRPAPRLRVCLPARWDPYAR